MPLYTHGAGAEAEAAPFNFPHLPPPSQWRSTFSFTRESNARFRYFVANAQTAQQVVAKLGLDDPARKGIKTTVVEAYAGPGTLTRELLKQPSVERVIALESVDTFCTWLEKLRDDPAMAEYKDKLEILRGSGYAWDTYETLVNDGYLRHLEEQLAEHGEHASSMNWEGASLAAGVLTADPSPLYFVAQLPNTVHGEQLFAQIVHAISSGSWLFKFGRVKMAFVCGESVATVRARSEAQLTRSDHLRSRLTSGIVRSSAQPYRASARRP